MLWIDALVLIFGLMIGSFLNVCIYRLPKGLSVVAPRSRCPECERPVRPWENIPVVSYLLLRGRCAGCGSAIGWIYPVVEVFSALSFYLLFRKYGLTGPLLLNAILFSLLIVLIFVDLFERLLPNVITLGGMAAGFALAPLQSQEFLGPSMPLRWLSQFHPWVSAYGQSFLGALVGGGLLWLVATLYFKIKKVEGMGFGDIKMMAMVGAFLGWPFAWLTIFLGSVMGAVIGVIFIYAFRKGRRYELPFGSFLGVAALMVTLWGKAFLDWYLL